jgi:hypothetical protein
MRECILSGFKLSPWITSATPFNLVVFDFKYQWAELSLESIPVVPADAEVVLVNDELEI